MYIKGARKEERSCDIVPDLQLVDKNRELSFLLNSGNSYTVVYYFRDLNIFQNQRGLYIDKLIAKLHA